MILYHQCKYIIYIILKYNSILSVPLLFISFSNPYIHKVIKKDRRFRIRIIYFLLAIFVDILSSIKKINNIIIHIMTWTLSFISLSPYPLYNTAKNNNLLLKILLYILPFYTLLTRSYESIFLILFYDYLQLWIKLKWRLNSRENRKYNFNLIDIFMYVFFLYTSAFSTGNVASISGFTLSSVFRFISKYYPILITILIMIKVLLPSIFVTLSLLEICKIYKYSTWDSLFILIAMCEIMNLKFFFDIRDFGSWREIGMSIAFFIISNVIAFLQFFTFLGAKFIYWLDSKINYKREIKFKKINLGKQSFVDFEGNILIIK